MGIRRRHHRHRQDHNPRIRYNRHLYSDPQCHRQQWPDRRSHGQHRRVSSCHRRLRKVRRCTDRTRTLDPRSSNQSHRTRLKLRFADRLHVHPIPCNQRQWSLTRLLRTSRSSRGRQELRRPEQQLRFELHTNNERSILRNSTTLLHKNTRSTSRKPSLPTGQRQDSNIHFHSHLDCASDTLSFPQFFGSLSNSFCQGQRIDDE